MGPRVYHTFLKRTSTLTLTVLVSAFIFERTFTLVADNMFRIFNKGKSWEDVKSSKKES